MTVPPYIFGLTVVTTMTDWVLSPVFRRPLNVATLSYWFENINNYFK